MSSTIALTGMMGAGKTTVGRALALRLGRRLVDTDDEIERWVGRSVAEIFATRGEEAFRGYEAVVVRELSAVPDLVLALGGGTVMDDGPVADLTLTGVLVHLDVPVEELARRVGDGSGRPLLDGDPVVRLAEVHAARNARYLEVADVVLDADRPVDEVVDALLAWLRHHRDVLTPSELEAILS